ncbi:hypothetical protein QUF74_01175 [Candidatus Halobeggiatoa sp. HSG11]|nr:hypothetical protein [Candidatus Halobeggiatoa sp. HSG11]
MLNNLFSKFNNKNSTSNKNVKILDENEINHARELLKEATQLKKLKKFDEACDKLKEAYSAKGSEELMTKERLRLPMYLQLAGKNDEGWKILNELNITYTDAFSQLSIVNQMRIFLQKEKKYKHAVIFDAWCICKGIECDRFNIHNSISMTDEMVKFGKEFDYNLDEIGKNDEVYGYTPNGNPIFNKLYKISCEQMEKGMSLDGVKNSLLSALKKAKLDNNIDKIAKDFSLYLKESNHYNFNEVRDYFNKIFE